MKPSRPAVVSGVRVTWGRVSMMRAARWRALTSLSSAQPGWIETPVIFTTALSAEKVS